jgi:Zn-dependent protease with chaperone function
VSVERVRSATIFSAVAPSSTSGEPPLDLSASYYDSRSSQPIDARLVVDPAGRVLVSGAGIDAEWAASELRVEPPILGSTPRAVLLPNGAKLESLDEAAMARLQGLIGRPVPFATIYRWEQSWVAATGAAALVLAVLAASYLWIIPWGAAHVARSSPTLARKIGNGTLALLDTLFDESELSPAESARIRGVFERVKADYPRVWLTLELRKAGVANAFALPDGTVVLTDEIVRLSEHDDQLEAVLWHEVGHVVHGHGLRRVIESSLFAVLAMTYYGDADLVTTLAGGLPLVYAKSRYSRAEETEADGAALDGLQRHGKDPRHFARILALLERQQGPGAPELRYFSSHPAMHERIERFERAAASRDPRPGIP